MIKSVKSSIASVVIFVEDTCFSCSRKDERVLANPAVKQEKLPQRASGQLLTFILLIKILQVPEMDCPSAIILGTNKVAARQIDHL